MGSISNISGGYVQSILNTVLQGAGLNTNQSTLNSVTSTSQQPDSGQLSPFTQVLSTLQQLQQSNPTEYQQFTEQISTNLQSAAQSAQSEGNTNAANQLNQLATDFKSASQNDQLPNVQDLSQALSGHHHHGHHAHGSSSSSSDSDSTSSTTSTSSSQTLSQLLASFESSSTSSIDPTAIILNTLSSAGIGLSNS